MVSTYRVDSLDDLIAITKGESIKENSELSLIAHNYKPEIVVYSSSTPIEELLNAVANRKNRVIIAADREGVKKIKTFEKLWQSYKYLPILVVPLLSSIATLTSSYILVNTLGLELSLNLLLELIGAYGFLGFVIGLGSYKCLQDKYKQFKEKTVALVQIEKF